MRGFWKYTACAFALTLLVSCNEDGSRGCLGGGAICNPQSTVQINQSSVEANSSTSNQTSSGFTCTATPNPAQAYPYQWISITINVTGGAAGNKTITNFNNYQIPSFSSSATIVGNYNPDKAGTVVRRTVDLRDSAGATTSCDFQVSILPLASQAPACTITVQESNLVAGQTANLIFNATGASNVTFSNLYGSSNWRLDDNLIQRLGPTQARASLTYSYAGPKTVTVQVSNGNVSSTCSTSFTVGPTGINVTQMPSGSTTLAGAFHLIAQPVGITNANNVTFNFTTSDSRGTIVRTGPNSARVTSSATSLATINVVVSATINGQTIQRTVPLSFSANPPPTPLNGCSVFVSPSNAATMVGAPVSVNTSARMVVMPQGGVGPFLASVGSITQGGAAFPYTLEAANSDPQIVNLRFNQVGTPMVVAILRDTFTGQLQFCSTYAVVQ